MTANEPRTPAKLEILRKAAALAQQEMLLDGRLDEPLRIQIKRDFDTACWSWQGDVHRVFLGDGVFDRARPGLSAKQLTEYAGRYAHHERAHALFTERDPAKLNRWLSARAVPFPLFNLVEDARVESRYRNTSDEPFAFGWVEFEDLLLQQPKEDAPAGSVFWWGFFVLIQSEGVLPEVFVERFKECQPLACADGFYRRAAALNSTADAVPLCAEIIKLYPELASEHEGAERCGLSIGAAMSGPGGKAKLDAFAADALTAEADPPSSQHSQSGRGVQADSGHSSEEIGDRLLGDPGSLEVFPERAQRIADRLASLRGKNKVSTAYVVRPGKRVSLRHALGGNARWARKRSREGESKVQSVLLVVDVSGSMEGDALTNAGVLIGALSRCAQDGELKGEVVLSTTATRGRRASLWMRKALPWQDDEISRITSHDSEGLCATLSDHDDLIREVDEVYVFTDANIGGPAIPHRAYERRGLRMTGLYCNEEGLDQDEVEAQMAEHFSRFIVRNTIEGLVDAIVSG